MAKAQPSVYQRTKEFLVARPNQFFTSETVKEGLKLKNAGRGIKLSKTLATLARGKTNGIERRQNEQGRFEYSFAGKQATQPSPRPTRRSTPRVEKAEPPRPEARSSSIKKLANFIHAYLELAPDERREALAWLNEQLG
jgi:hypothetical protein